jgi:hypothetical protein
MGEIYSVCRSLSEGDNGNLDNELTELTFFTNEPDAAILDRFRKNIEDVGLNRTVFLGLTVLC